MKYRVFIVQLSQTLKERENSWKNQSKELEEHYGKLITDLHHRVQASFTISLVRDQYMIIEAFRTVANKQALQFHTVIFHLQAVTISYILTISKYYCFQKTQEVADESWQNLQQLNTIREELEVQNRTLKNSRKKYIKEKTALLASCALLSGTLWPAFTQIEILKSQKRCLSDMNLRLNKLHEHAVFLCDTLNSELGGDAAQGAHALLKFRVGVVAVLALHRFVNLALRRKTCITVPGGPVEGLETKLVVHCGRSKSSEVEFRGTAIIPVCIFM